MDPPLDHRADCTAPRAMLLDLPVDDLELNRRQHAVVEVVQVRRGQGNCGGQHLVAIRTQVHVQLQFARLTGRVRLVTFKVIFGLPLLRALRADQLLESGHLLFKRLLVVHTDCVHPQQFNLRAD